MSESDDENDQRRLAPADVPGPAVSALLGAFDRSGDAPRDLAARHDDYLFGDEIESLRAAMDRRFDDLELIAFVFWLTLALIFAAT